MEILTTTEKEGLFRKLSGCHTDSNNDGLVDVSEIMSEKNYSLLVLNTEAITVLLMACPTNS